ncbi:MAG: serine hydrolase, partial [Candidatus Marinimicrobia bacterium]|nr:serine hydrolase [Candidatus Neomarinimicrobiota bacterium]
IVGQYAGEYIRGLHDHGVAGTAKHFPGHGDTETDSHSSLAMVPSDSARLWSLELLPFQAAIDAGIEAVMVGHLQSPDYQTHAGTPATMSKFWIEDVLRKRMDFQGVVITDAMRMGGIAENFSPDYALINAINAGVDLIIQAQGVRTSIDVVERAVNNGIISERRIDEAALRVLLLKERLGLHRNRFNDYQLTRSQLGRSEYRESAGRIAAESITMVRNRGSLVPLKYTAKEDTLIVIDLYDYPYNHRLSTVTRGIINSGLPAKPFQLDASDSPATYQAILDTVPDGARVLVNAFVGIAMRKDRIFLPEEQEEFLHELMGKTARVIMVSLGTPYLVQALPELPAYLCAYNSTYTMQSAAASALLGYTAISGRLPVSIPGICELGAGLESPVDSLVLADTSAMLIYTLCGDGPDRVTIEVPDSLYLPTVLRRTMPYEVEADISSIPGLLQAAVADSAWPGGVLLGIKDGQIFIHEAFGYHTYAKNEPDARGDIFDLASITKVVATTSAIMKLYDCGKLKLDDQITKFMPEFRGPTREQTRLKSSITIRNLITHTAGLPPFKAFYQMEGSVSARLDSIYQTALDTIPGVATVYSDIGIIILGKLVERLSGMTLAAFVDSNIFQPLGMTSTYFNPPAQRMKRIVPTEYSIDEQQFVRGHVHDENAYSLGGIAGHAGLFSTAADLAIFAQMMMNKGAYRDSVVFLPNTVNLFTRRANVVAGSSRCLGWDSPEGEASSGVYASSNSYGHTGFTGTSLWIDPDNEIIVILLTNAVHPERSWKHPKYYDWRQRIHSAVYESLPDQVRNPELELKQRWAQHNRDRANN